MSALSPSPVAHAIAARTKVLTSTPTSKTAAAAETNALKAKAALRGNAPSGLAAFASKALWARENLRREALKAIRLESS